MKCIKVTEFVGQLEENIWEPTVIQGGHLEWLCLSSIVPDETHGPDVSHGTTSGPRGMWRITVEFESLDESVARERSETESEIEILRLTGKLDDAPGVEVEILINDRFKTWGVWDHGKLTVQTDGLPGPGEWTSVKWQAVEEEELSVGICAGCRKTHEEAGHRFTRRAIRKCASEATRRSE